VNPAEVEALGARIRAEVAKAVVGQAETVELMLTALLSGGHILLEGPPGLAKTLLAQCFARTLDLGFGRIQFTPDLMPGDVLGASIFNFQTGAFTLRRGPIFCDLLLADEINRTPPKTQAALLEAMQERRVTLDGKPEALSARFMVIATQNPIEQQGVYPLPEAQLDRFLFKHVLGYPSLEQEQAIVRDFGSRTSQPDAAELGVTAVLGASELTAATEAVRAVRLGPEVAAYVTALVRATRESPDIQAGASPRAGVHLAVASRARAALSGRDYVIPDDVKALAQPALRHRLLLWPAAEIEGKGADDVLTALIARVDAPR
jgi:MoxR-like ATPase